MIKIILIISFGASFGAVLRYFLSMFFNSIIPSFFLGTLIVNLLGGFLIGILFGLFSVYSELNESWKLLLMTGFCGSLTTFSTFSLELFVLFQDEKFLMVLLTFLSHFIGSIVLTVVGWFFINWCSQLFS